MKYYTEYGVDITNRIKNGRTLFFIGTDTKTRQKVSSEALKKRSYFFEVFSMKNQEQKKLVGYAIPK